jgi:hypothetical protein
VIDTESGDPIQKVLARVSVSHLDDSSLIDGTFSRSYYDSAAERKKYRRICPTRRADVFDFSRRDCEIVALVSIARLWMIRLVARMLQSLLFSSACKE